MTPKAAFVDGMYKAVKLLPSYEAKCTGKKVTLALDNAPAYQSRVAMPDDLVFLRLDPRSPMCNPIKRCFSALKAKEHLRLSTDELIASRGIGPQTK